MKFNVNQYFSINLHSTQKIEVEERKIYVCYRLSWKFIVLKLSFLFKIIFSAAYISKKAKFTTLSRLESFFYKYFHKSGCNFLQEIDKRETCIKGDNLKIKERRER